MADEKKEGAQGIEGFGELLGKLAEAKSKFEEEHGELEIGKEMKYPMEVSRLVVQGFDGRQSQGLSGKAGALVRIRPVRDKKTYLGLYLGDLSREVMFARGPKSKALLITERTNPAIWVFELNKVVWGDSSWWGKVEKPEDIDKLISDLDIENIWYVKVLKKMLGEKKQMCPHDGVSFEKIPGYVEGYGCPVCKGLSNHLEMDVCPKCNGTGAEYKGENQAFTCPECDGDGVIKEKGEEDVQG